MTGEVADAGVIGDLKTLSFGLFDPALKPSATCAAGGIDRLCRIGVSQLPRAAVSAFGRKPKEDGIEGMLKLCDG